MKYDFTRCNNLQFKAKDDGGKVREGFLKVSSGGTVYVYYSNENKIFDHFLQIEVDGYHGIFTDATKFGEWAEHHELEIIPRDPDTYKDWKVGDRVIHNEMRRITYIAAKLGDIVFLLDKNDYTVSSPCSTVQLTKYFTLLLTDYEKELIHAQELEEKKKECQFKEGDRVLVRDDENQTWEYDVFVEYCRGSEYPYGSRDQAFKQCIPLNEHTWQLLGTTDEYKEE
jgi:hypothetical protein